MLTGSQISGYVWYHHLTQLEAVAVEAMIFMMESEDKFEQIWVQRLSAAFMRCFCIKRWLLLLLLLLLLLQIKDCW